MKVSKFADEEILKILGRVNAQLEKVESDFVSNLSRRSYNASQIPTAPIFLFAQTEQIGMNVQLY